LYSGLVLATSVGLFLFTRILIPDVILTLTVTLAMWSFLRALEAPSLKWPRLMAASIAIGLLLKGLIAAVFPIAAAGLYLLFTRQMFVHETWRRLRPFEGLAILLMIAAPWHLMATRFAIRHISISHRGASPVSITAFSGSIFLTSTYSGSST
jgi:4-amino-4-deoxy-L-arabinose transferase-like glycosyltransferase